MDTVLPSDLAGNLPGTRTRSARRGAPYSVRWADVELPVVELTQNGFILQADDPPPMPGYADIFQGDERILYGLAMCTWARDGLVGYEFKRGSAAQPVRPDHAPPAHEGLLNPPD